jgi:glutathione S-transferase
MSRARIHGYLISTWTRTACITCVEKGVEYELVPVKRGGDEHRAMHPFARMPVLEHDGRFIAESLAVTGYLDEAFPGPPLLPADPAQRTRVREWQGLCADYGFREVVRTVPRDREPSEEELAIARSVLERFDVLAAGDAFLVGDAFTLADAYLAPQIANAQEKAPQLLDGLAALAAWYSRIQERDSFRDTRRER